MAYLPSSRDPIVPSTTKVAQSYIFDATGSSVSVTAADLNDILFIVNCTDGIVIFNPVESGLGGTRVDGSISLEFDCTSMSDTDWLLILYSPNPSIAELSLLSEILTQMQEQTKLLRKIYG